MDHILFIQPSINTHLGCSHLLAILPHAAMNMGIPIALWVPAFNSLRYVLRIGIGGSNGNLILLFFFNIYLFWEASQVALVVKNLPANAGDSGAVVLSLGWKIPWRRKWRPSPAFFAWRIPQTEEPGRPQSMGSQRVGRNWATEHLFIFWPHWVFVAALGLLWAVAIQDYSSLWWVSFSLQRLLLLWHVAFRVCRLQ